MSGGTGLDLYQLPLVPLGSCFTGATQADLDLALERKDLGDHAGAVGGVDEGALGRGLLDLLGVGVILVA